MAKKYRLLKDLPFAEAGAIFQEWTAKRNEKEEKALVNADNLTTTLWSKDIDNFDDWFEEVKEPKIFFTIDIYKSKFKEINTDYYSGWSALEVKNIKDLGLLFKTVEKTKKYLKYLKAKEIIKQDTKGFKPDWNNLEQIRFYGRWDFQSKIPFRGTSFTQKDTTIYFKTVEDIEESFERHPEEWKTYLTYEQ